MVRSWILNLPRNGALTWMVRTASPEPSTMSGSSVDGPLLNIEPSMIWASNVDGSAVLYRTIHDIDLHRGRSRRGSPSDEVNDPEKFVNVKQPSPESVTKRAERAKRRARAACFEQPDGVYSGCVDAIPTTCTFVTQSIHDRGLSEKTCLSRIVGMPAG